MKIIIMRGIPGAGKSTWVKNNHPNAVVVSADDYFTLDGVYKHDPAHEGDAHGFCFKQAIEHLSRLTSYPGLMERHNPTADLVVDNTNTTVAEAAPYVLLAQAYDVGSEIVTLQVDVETALSRNSRGVPEHIVRAMDVDLRTQTLMPWRNETEIEV